MSAASFVDTNILLYADDHDEPAKQSVALSLLESGYADGTLFVSTQVLEEYFVGATKKLGVPAVVARAKVELFGRLNLVTITLEDVLGAIDVHRLHHLAFWDGLLVQCARRVGCSVLLTEDLQDGRRFDGVTVKNPFSAAKHSRGR